VEAASVTAQLESTNPATGETVGSVAITAPEDVQAVVDQVASVQPFWAQLALEDRARYLERAAQVVIDECDEIRDLLVREQGKPRNEALSMQPASLTPLIGQKIQRVFEVGADRSSGGEACGRALKGSVLELGGKDPMIVLADANLEHAVAGAVWGGFANAGQTCSGIERVYVTRVQTDAPRPRSSARHYGG
jgi:acyl-CoA reductase-like NAD-dependent aldehyde dehydrogenase